MTANSALHRTLNRAALAPSALLFSVRFNAGERWAVIRLSPVRSVGSSSRNCGCLMRRTRWRRFGTFFGAGYARCLSERSGNTRWSHAAWFLTLLRDELAASARLGAAALVSRFERRLASAPRVASGCRSGSARSLPVRRLVRRVGGLRRAGAPGNPVANQPAA